jgi:hypothetical protein
MKNKGLGKLIAAIAAITIIGIIAVVGFSWGRFGFRGFGQGTFFPIMGRGWKIRADGNTDVLSLEEAEGAIQSYLSTYSSDEELHIGEIMIFDNQAYAEIVEEGTGIGAFELLVDPSSLSVYPEQGPNMMWNLKYGHMRGGMMGGVNYDESIDLPIGGEEAIQIAEEYLNRNGSNLTVDDHPDQFYGYYTIHTLIDGEVVGMLSVNGYSGQIIIHTWHGEFIEMSEYEEA